jgi:hypothetical protein
MFSETTWKDYECRRCHKPVRYKQMLANDGTHFDCADPWGFARRQAQIDAVQRELDDDKKRAEG